MVISLKNYFNDKYIKKRLLCFTLCILVIFTTMMIQLEEAHAFVPIVIAGVAIAPEVVAAGACLLTAAGLTFASSADAQEAFGRMWVQGGENLRNNLSIIGTGIVNISDSLWTSVQGWVKSNFTTGTNTKTDNLNWFGTNLNYPISKSSDSVFYPIGVTFAYGTHSLLIQDTGNTYTYQGITYHVYRCRDNGNSINAEYIVSKTFPTLFLQATSSGVYCSIAYTEIYYGNIAKLTNMLLEGTQATA